MVSNATIVPVILCGGQGKRLWPLSRTKYPKQFLRFQERPSLFQEVLQRFATNANLRPAIALTGEDYRFLVAEQAREVDIDLDAIMLEPSARNTAPAIAIAAHFLAEREPGALMYVVPSDHQIVADAAYWEALERAANAASDGHLVTFGIKPTKPETGYGYIRTGTEVADGVNKVARFIEKPQLDKAEEMIAAGGHFWNSGMFLFRADRFLEELSALAPDIFNATKAATESAEKDLDFVRVNADAFGESPSISIDYAVFEKTDAAAVVPCEIEWSDLGSWQSYHEMAASDANNNVVEGSATLVDVSNSLAMSEGQHVAVLGLDNVAVISTHDAVLVMPLSRSQDIRQLVETIAACPDNSSLVDLHKTVYRPWGGYTSVIDGERFQVKRLFVLPGKQLSLQKHFHRSEHWIVVRGTAEVVVGDEKRLLTENQSTYIPAGTLHRLINPGKINLELIEVQSGAYLGEDDIVRFEDDFGRC